MGVLLKCVFSSLLARVPVSFGRRVRKKGCIKLALTSVEALAEPVAHEFPDSLTQSGGHGTRKLGCDRPLVTFYPLSIGPACRFCGGRELASPIYSPLVNVARQNAAIARPLKLYLNEWAKRGDSYDYYPADKTFGVIYRFAP